MNIDIAKGFVTQLKGQSQKALGKLIECDRDIDAGNRLIFDGKIQVRLGIAKIKAHRDFRAAH